VYMFEERLMPPEPEDELERLFAAEEQAIRDDGFSERVAERAGRGTALRQFAIYGSGLAGLGFAVGGIAELSPYLPNFAAWFENAAQAAASINVQETVQGASDGMQLAAVAMVAGLAFLLTAVSLQNR
jgi:hypothetical protein